MAKYLATFNDTLGDIEIHGFVTMTDKEMDNFEELASSITWDFVYPIANEELVFTSGEDLLTRIDFREISNDEFKILKKVFDTKFGIFIDEDYLQEVIGGEGTLDESSEEDDDYYSRDESEEDEDDDY